tara:strand:- start:14795 stop:14923 length:129 start_codon:yes stop_codon:yes gene_type:complete
MATVKGGGFSIINKLRPQKQNKKMIVDRLFFYYLFFLNYIAK